MGESRAEESGRGDGGVGQGGYFSWDLVFLEADNLPTDHLLVSRQALGKVGGLMGTRAMHWHMFDALRDK